ncbi:hypothetical protein DMENIID0001_143050 [Sergentomyia squamirostris]
MATGGIPDPHSDHPMITNDTNLPVDPKKNDDVNKTAVRVFTGADVYQPVRMSNKRNRQGQSVEHSTAGTTPIATSNRFALLANASNGKAKSSPRSNQQPAQKTVQTQPQKPEKPAPFYVRDTRVIEILDDIMTENQISNYDRTILRMGNEAKLQVSTVDDYRKIQKAFNEKGIPYFTFQLKSERSLKVVIKGIPPYITAEKVKSGLVQSGFKPRSAQTILNHKGEKCCMVMVELERREQQLANRAYRNVREGGRPETHQNSREEGRAVTQGSVRDAPLTPLGQSYQPSYAQAVYTGTIPKRKPNEIPGIKPLPPQSVSSDIVTIKDVISLMTSMQSTITSLQTTFSEMIKKQNSLEESVKNLSEKIQSLLHKP